MNLLKKMRSRYNTQHAVMKKRILIVLRAGEKSIHSSWSEFLDDDFDLIVSTYEPVEGDDKSILQHHFQGGKYIGIFDLFRNNSHLIDEYDFFWFVEDDLYIPRKTFITMKKLIHCYNFSLLSPSLCPASFYSWPIMLRNRSFQFRLTNFVEQMAPLMSRSLLLELLPLFNENQTGWGYEWLWSAIMSRRGECSVIADCAPITHTRPIRRGNLYVNTGVDAEADMHAFLKKFGLSPEKNFHNFFAIDVFGHPVNKSTFSVKGPAGYQEVFTENMNRQAWSETQELFNEHEISFFNSVPDAIKRTLSRKSI